MKIPAWMRLVVLTYFVVFELIAHIIQMATEENMTVGLLGVVVLRVLNAFFQIIPILFFRHVGIMHLLVFPYFLGLVKRLFQNTISFIVPFVGEGVQLKSTSAVSLSREVLISLNVESELYVLLTFIFLYLGYLGTRRKIKLKMPSVNRIPSNWRFATLSLIVLVVTFIFFSIQGGVIQWISSWGASGGRRAATEAFGPILRLLEVAYFVPLTWYAYRGNKAFRSSLFIVVLLVTVFLGFFATGSRSSVMLTILSFLVIYSLRTRKLPILRYIGAAAVFFVLFGLFGQIRSASTFNQGNIDVDEISLDYSENLKRAVAEANEWASLGADIAIYYNVPEEHSYLYGKTYAAFLTFWLPRSLWADKPHGAGYYLGKEIYGAPAGIPPTAVAEAYWNFGIIGVMLLAFLNGALIRVISEAFVRYDHIPAIRVIYVVILVTGVSMSTLALTGILQKLIYIILGFKFLRVK